MHNILTNIFYTGAIRVKGEVHQGSHRPPHISKEQFDLVQAALSGRRLTCGTCRRQMSGFAKTKPSGRRYVYHVCSKHLQGACPQPLMPAAKLSPHLYRILSRITCSPAEYATAFDVARQVEAAEKPQWDSSSTKQRLWLRTRKRGTARPVDLLLAEKISEAEYDRKRRELEAARFEQTFFRRCSSARMAFRR